MEAIVFAELAHGTQTRKGFNAPFITHPIAVAAIVMEYTGKTLGSDIVTAALLHDVVEDTEYTNEDIAERYGSFVAAIVANVTHVPTLKGKEKREAYIRAIRETVLYEAVIVSCADKLDNLRSIRHQQLIDMDGAREFKNGMWFYDRLLPIYQSVLPTVMKDAPALLTIFKDTLDEVKAAYGSTSK